MFRTVRIDRADNGNVFLLFRSIDRRPCRTMDDCVRTDFSDDGMHLFSARDIQPHIGRRRDCAAVGDAEIFPGNIASDRLVSARNKFVDDVMSELSVDACYKDLHFLFPYICR